MFAKVAEKLTKKLLENNSISCEQFEICRYGFQQGLTIMLNAFTVIIIGIVMRELQQAILFMLLYAPLRINAGGYHARTAIRCYVYSVFLMIAIILAIKYLCLNEIICIITFVVSCTIILILAPVEDKNKPLDDIEQVVYKKRTYIITALESIIFLIAIFFRVKKIILCATLVVLMMSCILAAGKYKNKFGHKSNNVKYFKE